jgi:hypothetical protein
MKTVLAIVMLSLVGCASIRDVARTSLTAQEREAVIAKARALALESGLVEQSERGVVERLDLELAYYFMAGVHYAQYFITWKVSERDGIQVYGEGDLLDLEGARVKRLSNQTVQRTRASRFVQGEMRVSSAASSDRNICVRP